MNHQLMIFWFMVSIIPLLFILSWWSTAQIQKIHSRPANIEDHYDEFEAILKYMILVIRAYAKQIESQK